MLGEGAGRATLREHLQQVAAAGGPVDERLTPVPIPSALAPLWMAFLQLATARGGGMGAQPIAVSDVDAWCRLSGARLTPWELDTLLLLDATALAAAARKPDR